MTTLLRTRLIFTTKSGLASAEGSIFSLSDKSCSWNKILRLLFVNHHQRQAPRCLSSSTICSPPRPSEKLNQRSYFSICQRQPLLRSDDVRAFGLFRLSRQSSFSSRSPSSDNKSSKKRSDDDSDKEQPTNISSTSSKTSDPPVWTWVSQVLPTRWQPYARLARLDKPIGTMLLVSNYFEIRAHLIWTSLNLTNCSIYNPITSHRSAVAVFLEHCHCRGGGWFAQPVSVEFVFGRSLYHAWSRLHNQRSVG